MRSGRLVAAMTATPRRPLTPKVVVFSCVALGGGVEGRRGGTFESVFETTARNTARSTEMAEHTQQQRQNWPKLAELAASFPKTGRKRPKTGRTGRKLAEFGRTGRQLAEKTRPPQTAATQGQHGGSTGKCERARRPRAQTQTRIPSSSVSSWLTTRSVTPVESWPRGGATESNSSENPQ